MLQFPLLLRIWIPHGKFPINTTTPRQQKVPNETERDKISVLSWMLRYLSRFVSPTQIMMLQREVFPPPSLPLCLCNLRDYFLYGCDLRICDFSLKVVVSMNATLRISIAIAIALANCIVARLSVAMLALIILISKLRVLVNFQMRIWKSMNDSILQKQERNASQHFCWSERIPTVLLFMCVQLFTWHQNLLRRLLDCGKNEKLWPLQQLLQRSNKNILNLIDMI